MAPEEAHRLSLDVTPENKKKFAEDKAETACPGSISIWKKNEDTEDLVAFEGTVPANEVAKKYNPLFWGEYQVFGNGDMGTGTNDWALKGEYYVLSVTITQPMQYPAFICKGDELEVGCEASTPGGDFSWGKLSGPGAVTFLPDATTQNPRVVFSEPGKYTVKVSYTLGAASVSDNSDDIAVWQILFEEDNTTHASIEGRDPTGTYVLGGDNLIGQYGEATRSSSNTSSSIASTCVMITKGADFVAVYGAGSHLQPSGEIRHDIWLDFGDASYTVNIEAAWNTNVSLLPKTYSTIRNGGTAIISLNGVAGIHEYLMGPSGYVETLSGSNPLTHTFSITKKAKIGMFEAGVSYFDYGAMTGRSSCNIVSNFSVSSVP